MLVSGGRLDWSGPINGNGDLLANDGEQNWTFRTAPEGATHFDWAPYIARKDYVISYTFHTAWANPLTFALSDNAQAGTWTAYNDAAYDYAFLSFGSHWRIGADGNGGQDVSGASGNTSYELELKFYEQAGFAEAWVDGSLIHTQAIDFDMSGRYFSFGSAGKFGGNVDHFKVKITP